MELCEVQGARPIPVADSHYLSTGPEPICSGWRVGRRNHDPELRHGKASDGRTRREAASRATSDAGRRPGDPPVGGNLWDPGGKPRNSAEPVWHRHDNDCNQRRPRWSSVGVRGDYAENLMNGAIVAGVISIILIYFGGQPGTIG